MSDVQIRILSGVNLGADIVLTAGRWVFGQDDSCDIILSGSGLAARHAVLIADDAGLRFEALDGSITSATDDPIAGDLAAGTIYKMGPVLFAWGAQDAQPDFWATVQQSLKTLAAPEVVAVAPAEDAAAEETAEKQSDSEAKSDSAEKDDEKTAKEDEAKAEKTGSKKAALAGVAVAVLLAAGAAGWWYWMHHVQSGAEDPAAAVLAQAARHVKSAGFSDVVVKRDASGALILTGSVKNDDERGRLVALARLLDAPASLSVTVDSDYTEPLRSALNTLDFWPEVTLDKTAKSRTVNVAAYMMTNVAEEQAFQEALKDLPTAGDFKLQRRILHKEEVEQVFLKAFRAAGVEGAKLAYLPGRIRVVTTLTPDRKEKLDKALADIKRTASVPLQIDVVNEADQNVAVRETKIATAPKPPADPMKPVFRVSGVSGGALKFVTLSSGEKVFAGGRLPGGFVLEAVQYDKLVLSKNGKRVIYPLRINK